MSQLLSLGLAVASLGMGLGVRFLPRSSRVERLFTDLRQPGLPRLAGNLPVACTPAGGCILLIVLGLRQGGDLATPWIVAGLILGLVTIWFAWRPPGWAKPPWVVEMEASENLPTPVTTSTDLVVVAIGGTSVVITVVVVMFAVVRPHL